MINKATLTLIAATAALGIALPSVALAQSAYTTGTAANREAAGYPSPYGDSGNSGGGYYNYAPNSGYGRQVQTRQRQDRTGYDN